MPILRTRNIADPLSTLEQFIQQSEAAGAGLTSVVAGTVQGNAFNVVAFVFEPKTSPQITLQEITDPIDTDEQRGAVQQQLTGKGLTPLFFAPVFDSSQQINIAACRAGSVDGLMPPAKPLPAILSPDSNPNANPTGCKLFATSSSHESFRGCSSSTTGLRGTETILSDGSVVRDAKGTLSAVRVGSNFGDKDVSQHRVK